MKFIFETNAVAKFLQASSQNWQFLCGKSLPRIDLKISNYCKYLKR